MRRPADGERVIHALPADELDTLRDLREALHRHHDALPVPPGYRLRPFAASWKSWRDAVAAGIAAGTAVVLVHRAADGEPDGMAYLHLLDPVTITRPFLEPAGFHAELSTLVVSDAARSRGIGAELADAGNAWAHERGAVVLHIAVRATNVDARRLYLRRGGQPTFEVLLEPLQ